MSEHDTPTATPVSDALRAAGNWNPNWDPLAELDAGYTEKFMAMGAHAVARSGLDPLTVELIAIAVDAACTHLYAPGVRRHIRKALELGASREQVMGVLEMVSVLGIHSVALGVPILLDEERKLATEGPMQGTY